MRPTLLLVWTILVSVQLVSCSSRDDPPIHEGTLVVGVESNPTDLDPRFAMDAVSERITQLVYSGLLRMDRQSNPAPDLAESWENPDPATYIFHLRKGAKFHDGAEVKAEDVVYTYRSVLEPSLGSPKRGSFQTLEDVAAVDDYTVKFSLQGSFAPFLVNTVMGIVPEHVDRRGEDLSRKPIGSGPFRFVEWEPDQKVVLKSFSDYFEGAPKIRKLVLKIVPDATVRLLEMEKGDIHILHNNIPPDMVSRVGNDPRFRLYEGEGTSYTYIGFNLRKPPLDRAKVRRAIAHSINKDLIIQYVTRRHAAASTGLLPSWHWAYEGKVATYPHDPEGARRLLDQAGFPDPDGEGPMTRFSLTFKTSQNEVSRRIAEVVQEELRKVGIKVDIRSYEWGTFFADIRSGNFDFYTLSWVGITDPDIYYYVFHSGSVPPNGANRGRYSNAELDALLEEGRSEMDAGRRRTIYSRVQRILSEELPYISLWHANNISAVREEIGGYELYPSGDFTPFKDIYIIGR